MIRSLKNLKILPCVGLVMKYSSLSFVGHHYIFNSFLLIKSVIKNKLMWMNVVRLLLDDFPFFSRKMDILFSV